MPNQTDKNVRRNYIIFALIFAITFLSRYLFSENNFFDADTVGVAFGSISYSLQNTRPHLPGYFLHVKLISFLTPIFKDVHQTMIILSALYSSFGVLLSFVLLKKWMSEQHALIITLLIAFNPMVWFYGVTPEVYSIDLFFSVLIVLLGLKSKTIYTLPILVALLSGLRQSSAVLIIPVYLFLWIKKFRSGEISIPKFIGSHFVGLLIGLAWFLLMSQTAGGIKEYFELYKVNSPLPSISLLQNIYQFSSYCFYVFVPIIFIFLFIPLRKKSLNISFSRDDRDLMLLLALWFIPSFLVFTFFHYNKGYFLISIIPLYTLAELLLKKDIIKEWVCWSVIVLQILFFIFIPYREPSVESMLTPEKRNRNLFETWQDRTFSSYLMASSRIKYQDDMIKRISTIIKEDNSNKNSVILLDPTLNLFARGLQFQFPTKTFITLDLHANDYYYEYNRLNMDSRKGLGKILNGTKVLTRLDFYNNYLKFIPANIVTRDNIVMIEITSQNHDKILFTYEELFLRKK